MSYLETIVARAAVSPRVELPKGLEADFDGFGSEPEDLIPKLPGACGSGLRRLPSMPVPFGMPLGLWRLVVSEAQRLASEGWASNAFALGWTDLDLFGAVPDRDGDPAGDGLAVWLPRRKLLAISASFAVASDGSGGRYYFSRTEAKGAVLLWSLGR